MADSSSNTDLDASLLAMIRLLSADPVISQRELSRQLGWSLGKTHYLVRALVEKGLVKASNFRHSNNKAAYVYLLTPAGLKEKLRLTRSFLGRKELEFEFLRREIAELRAELDR